MDDMNESWGYRSLQRNKWVYAELRVQFRSLGSIGANDLHIPIKQQTHLATRAAKAAVSRIGARPSGELEWVDEDTGQQECSTCRA